MEKQPSFRYQEFKDLVSTKVKDMSELSIVHVFILIGFGVLFLLIGFYTK
jgi:hypothetical protein